MEKFSTRLKELRIERNLTQTELAKATGLSQNSIAQWENALREPKMKVIITLAQYFKVSTDYLLGLTDY